MTTDLATRPHERGQKRHHLLGLRRVVEQTHGKHCVGAAELANAIRRRLVVVLRLDELDVIVAVARKPALRGLELLLGAVDRDDPVEQGRQQLDQRAIAGAESRPRGPRGAAECESR